MKKHIDVYFYEIVCVLSGLPENDADRAAIYGIKAKTKPGSKLTIPTSLYNRILSRTGGVVRHPELKSKRSRDLKKPSVQGASRTASEPTKTEICPVCNGDGGVSGGCYKCDGTGWVTSLQKSTYQPPDISGWGDNSRVSNYDYLGMNQGAHFREKDGRIGSNPEHDDYSDESGA